MATGPEIPNFKQYSMKAAGSSGFLHNPARNKLFPFKKTEKRQGFFRLLVACVITAQPAAHTFPSRYESKTGSTGLRADHACSNGVIADLIDNDETSGSMVALVGVTNQRLLHFERHKPDIVHLQGIRRFMVQRIH